MDGLAPPGVLPWDSNSPSYLKSWIISTIISAMVYGGVLSLALSCIPLLLKSPSRRMCNYLLLYVAFMVTISTIYTITMVISLLNLNRFGTPLSEPGVNPDYQAYTFPNGYVGITCVTVATWGADGIMASI